MKNYAFIVFALLCLVSCNHQQATEKLNANTSYREATVADVLGNDNATPQSQPSERRIVSKESIQSLIDFKVIPANYNTELLFSESKYTPNDSVEVLLLKSHVDSVNLLKSTDPIINFVILIKKNRTAFVMPVSSASESDISYEGFFNHSAVFTYYSSAVGYSKILLIDSGNNVYLSGAVDEQESFDLNSLSTTMGTYIILPTKELRRDLKRLSVLSGKIISL
jgi:hypothetical protein